MTIANAISSALSGLGTRSREAAVASGNIANATSEDYARREIHVSAGPYGTVRVEGVRRAEDTRLSAEMRASDAARSGADTSADALARVERAFGSADDAGSLTAKLARVEAALTDAASDPSSEARLRGVSTALVEFTDGVQAASDAIRDARTAAEAGVEKDVEGLREGLSRIADLNGEIARAKALGRDPMELEDIRRAEIDRLALSVPVKAFERKDGMVSIVAEGGMQLLESMTPAEIDFTATRFVTADMTLGGGALDQVTVRGRDADPGTPGGDLSGGSLGANMALRDDTLPTLQARLDAFVADLAERLGPTGPAAAAGAAAPGLLVDRAGAAVAMAPGISGEVRVNPDVLDEPRRLRDGYASAAAGPAGQSKLLRGLADAMAELRPAPAGFAANSQNSSEILADVVSGLSSERLSAEARGAQHASMVEVLRQEERANGVDTDVELQRMMEIERGYAASARVLQAVDDMLERIMRI